MQDTDNSSNLLARSAARGWYTTEELAAALAVKPQTLLKRKCQTGTYYGAKPEAQANGKLRWPLDSVDIVRGEGAK